MCEQFEREYMPIVHGQTAYPLIMNMILHNMKRCLHVTYMYRTSLYSKYTLAS
jgi:hypothetical protein